MIDISKAIKAINPDAEFVYYDEDYNTIQWVNNTTPISVDKIKAKQTELDNDYAAKQYQRDRVKEYPSIGDQLDALFHAGVFPDDMAAQIQAVKDKYPKG